MLWKSNLWPNLLWYHEEPVSSNHCNPWHGCTAAFQECSLAAAPEGAVSGWVSTFGLLHWQIWESYTDNSQVTFVILLKWKWYGQSQYVWKGTSSEDHCGTGRFEMCGKEWDAAKIGQFSVHAIIAVYLPDVHPPRPWQELGWNQLTGWVVRGGTCLNNFSPVGAVVVWADSQRAKLAGF